jgi:photosystem II stability/assembly factor-like uncharacterized protein
MSDIEIHPCKSASDSGLKLPPPSSLRKAPRNAAPPKNPLGALSPITAVGTLHPSAQGTLHPTPQEPDSGPSVRSEVFKHRATPEYARATQKIFAERNSNDGRPGPDVTNEAPKQKPGGKAAWEFLGPDNIGGRITCLAAVPGKGKDGEDLLYAGAACGGVWRSEDSGKSWQQSWDDKAVTLNIGSLVLDPEDPAVIYCGTGHSYESGDSLPGAGIYRSVNGGKTWALSADDGIPQRISAIAIDPKKRQHVRMGGISLFGSQGSGMFVSENGGDSWKLDADFPVPVCQCHSVVFDSQGTLFTAISGGPQGGILRLKKGRKWERLTNGLPPGEEFGRTSLAIGGGFGREAIYALVANPKGGFRGIFRTSGESGDAIGDRWVSRGGSIFPDDGPMAYNNCIAVDREDPSLVLWGGDNLRRSTDGGCTWFQVTEEDAGDQSFSYAHADHHTLLIPRPNVVYDGNDGGVDMSDDGGISWVTRSQGLAITMFYDIDVARKTDEEFGGGTQDNGTVLRRAVTPQSNGDRKNAGGQPAQQKNFEFTQELDGDGGWMVYDKNNPSHIYGSSQNMEIYRYWPDTDWVDVTPADLDGDERLRVSVTVLAIDPYDSNTVFTGSTRVWRTRNDGGSWKPVSQHLDGSAITAIEIASADSRVIYVGTKYGGLFRSADGGNNWEDARRFERTISRIATDPKDARFVFVTVWGHDQDGLSHLYWSYDGGTSWNRDSKALPSVSHNAVVFNTDEPEYVFVANDVGVWASPDRGAQWYDITGNLPNVMVADLVYHAGSGPTLTAGTYGRGLWRLNVKKEQLETVISAAK